MKMSQKLNKKGEFDNIIIIIPVIMVIFLSFILMDAISITKYGITTEKCIDRNGNEFIDEYCNVTLKCSIFGVVTNNVKCSDINVEIKWFYKGE